MFTPLQFSQLAAAAWRGPAAAIIAGAQHYVSPTGEYTTTTYCASYHIGGVCYMGREACPFAAVQAALDLAAGAGVLGVAGVVAGTAVVQQAERVFAGAPAAQVPAAVVCATCGEAPDYFQQCRCCYTSVSHHGHGRFLSSVEVAAAHA